MHLIDATCRVCLSNQRLNSIFKKKLAEKIRYCASVQLSEDDELPKMICKQCLFYLDVAYIFRTVCEATDARLRKELNEKQLVENIVVKAIPVQQGNIPDHFYCARSNGFNGAKTTPVAENFYVIKSNNINGTTTIKKNQGQNVCVVRSNGVNGNKVAASKEVANIYVNNVKGTSVISAAVEDIHATKTGVNSTKATPTKRKKSGEFYIARSDRIKNTKLTPNKEKNNHIQNNGTNSAKAAPTKQEGENFHIIHVPVANEVVIGEEEPDSDVLSGSSSPAKSEKSTSETVGQKAPEDNKENQQKFGRHTARKKSAKVAKRIIPAEEPVNAVNKLEDKVIVQIEPTISENNENSKEECMNPVEAKKVEEKKTENNGGHVEEKKTHQCDQCDKYFSYKCMLIRHMAVHSKEKEYKCNQCSKSFRYKYNLAMHMQKHSGKFPLKCFFCNKGFSYPSSLKRHLVCHSGTTDYECKYCSKKLQYASSLRLHEKMHLYRPLYTCDVCFKTFAYTNSLAEHKKTHVGGPGYVCGTCNRQFMRKTSLRRHMAVHSVSKKPKFNFKVRLKAGSPKKGEKLKCNECSRQFTSKAVLIQHLKNHVGFHNS